MTEGGTGEGSLLPLRPLTIGSAAREGDALAPTQGGSVPPEPGREHRPGTGFRHGQGGILCPKRGLCRGGVSSALGPSEASAHLLSLDLSFLIVERGHSP